MVWNLTSANSRCVARKYTFASQNLCTKSGCVQERTVTNMIDAVCNLVLFATICSYHLFQNLCAFAKLTTKERKAEEARGLKRASDGVALFSTLEELESKSV